MKEKFDVEKYLENLEAKGIAKPYSEHEKLQEYDRRAQELGISLTPEEEEKAHASRRKGFREKED